MSAVFMLGPQIRHTRHVINIICNRSLIQSPFGARSATRFSLNRINETRAKERPPNFEKIPNSERYQKKKEGWYRLERHTSAIELPSGSKKELRSQFSVPRHSLEYIKETYPSDPLTSYHKDIEGNAKELSLLMRAGEKSEWKKRSTINNLHEILNKMKEDFIMPNVTTYELITKTYLLGKAPDLALDAVEDMKKIGLKPSISVYNNLLMLLSMFERRSLVQQIYDEMIANNVSPNRDSNEHLIRAYCLNDQLELALKILEDMNKNSIEPTPTTFRLLIETCVRLREDRMAYDLLLQAEQQRPITDVHLYYQVLAIAATERNFNAADYCWRKGVIEQKLRPDQGTCLALLNMGADPYHTSTLADDVMKYLIENRYPLMEHHFAPLVAAFAHKGDITNAFKVLSEMRDRNIPVSQVTAYPIYDMLEDNVHAISRAFKALLGLHKGGIKIENAGFNAVIHACAMAHDINLAVSIYNEAREIRLITPDILTYNALLDVCIETRNMDIGMTVIADMKASGVSPNVNTYSKLVRLACTQTNYEDAFKYLEEMKSWNIVPPEGCYAALVRKLTLARDPRAHIALEEMEIFGYSSTSSLRNFVQSGGRMYLLPSQLPIEDLRSKINPENDRLIGKRETEEIMRQLEINDKPSIQN